jgi:CBS domain containing-hemolysin-like protein
MYKRSCNCGAKCGVIALEYIIRPAYYAPENADVSEILREFKIGHQHIVIVIDEFGSIIGIASVEDLLKEIVGGVWDEDDLKQKTVMYIESNEESKILIKKKYSDYAGDNYPDMTVKFFSRIN